MFKLISCLSILILLPFLSRAELEQTALSGEEIITNAETRVSKRDLARSQPKFSSSHLEAKDAANESEIRRKRSVKREENVDGDATMSRVKRSAESLIDQPLKAETRKAVFRSSDMVKKATEEAVQTAVEAKEYVMKDKSSTLNAPENNLVSTDILRARRSLPDVEVNAVISEEKNPDDIMIRVKRSGEPEIASSDATNGVFLNQIKRVEMSLDGRRSLGDVNIILRNTEPVEDENVDESVSNREKRLAREEINLNSEEAVRRRKKSVSPNDAMQNDKIIGIDEVRDQLSLYERRRGELTRGADAESHIVQTQSETRSLRANKKREIEPEVDANSDVVQNGNEKMSVHANRRREIASEVNVVSDIDEDDTEKMSLHAKRRQIEPEVDTESHETSNENLHANRRRNFAPAVEVENNDIESKIERDLGEADDAETTIVKDLSEALLQMRIRRREERKAAVAEMKRAQLEHEIKMRERRHERKLQLRDVVGGLAAQNIVDDAASA